MNKLLYTLFTVLFFFGCKNNVTNYLSHSPYKIEKPLTLYEGYSIKSKHLADLKVDDNVSILFTGLNFNEQNDVYCIKVNGSSNTWDGFVFLKNRYLDVKDGINIPNYNWNVALNASNEVMAINIKNSKIVLLNKKNDHITELLRKDLIRDLPEISTEYYTFIIDDRMAGFINNNLYIKVGIEDMSTLKGYLVYDYINKTMKYIPINVSAYDLQINKRMCKLLYSNLPEFHEIDRLNEYIRKNNEIVYTFDLITLEQKAVASFNKLTYYAWNNNEINYKQ